VAEKPRLKALFSFLPSVKTGGLMGWTLRLPGGWGPSGSSVVPGREAGAGAVKRRPYAERHCGLDLFTAIPDAAAPVVAVEFGEQVVGEVGQITCAAVGFGLADGADTGNHQGDGGVSEHEF